ncbi:YfgM family protein [Flavobacterium sp. W21_SRS_FM6]|uniref:YfgM family protein n=1 Tax=Flavobacterium sp. W21_SRS_FM6 TaxID=3240268 RepID=UPI003F91B2EE
MERYETEEQQVEAIKRFWKENGMALAIGAIIGLGGLYGWRYYNEQQISAQESASLAYEEAATQLSSDEKGFSKAQNYVSEHADTGYAYLMSLELAQKAIERKDLDEANKQLSFVANNADVAAIKAIASIRLARVQIEQGQLAEALKSAELVSDDAFSGQVNEVKGDVYLAQQLFDKARAAYSAALEKNSNDGALKMKLDNLAQATAPAANG